MGGFNAAGVGSSDASPALNGCGEWRRRFSDRSRCSDRNQCRRVAFALKRADGMNTRQPLCARRGFWREGFLCGAGLSERDMFLVRTPAKPLGLDKFCRKINIWTSSQTDTINEYMIAFDSKTGWTTQYKWIRKLILRIRVEDALSNTIRCCLGCGRVGQMSNLFIVFYVQNRY